MKLIHFPDTHDQKWGVQNDRLDKVFKTEPDKKNIFSFLCPYFGKTFWSLYKKTETRAFSSKLISGVTKLEINRPE